ncbi:unnamed protein product [Sphagnum jensenii]|uniref:Kinesin motor domain-containing protein n=1 Tax=Sphagnum jensenii TaxID=128206 RepID=A0ABP0W0J8_9BRYO
MLQYEEDSSQNFMESSSLSKARPGSPYRFTRVPSTNQGKWQYPSPSQTGYQTPTSTASSKTSNGFAGRSLTPNRTGRAISSTPSSFTPQQKFRLSSIGNPFVQQQSDSFQRDDFLSRAKENVSVTVRFRPLNQREIQRGDEVAWYADGDSTVRSELCLSTAYAFDRVFGPATTTRGVYDVAAQHVVSGAMQGVNGTVFAYGVTSSGKTHTMHGDQKSPGIIPLAIKDLFSIIQETPSREFLLRVSYLEIYNEVINDLLNPIGQNLRIREDGQHGTYVEGIKEEVVLSPAHALSLIAAGEAHRHVGSNNFNLLSSRSHTIFTLTVESSPRCDVYSEDDITLSQLNLIDLAGSESSRTETTGLRRKEGSYINKSLLTLGTVIAKLSDGKASHIPYRDSKLTRLLQSSLSGHGQISLICTITPASSNSEETHNTLKFAHRAKRIEIHAASNRILDERSLIKKYQKEISSLKSELERLKRGILQQPYVLHANHEHHLAHLRQQLEAGQVKMQSRLEEEEQAKAALMGRIQRLTKLILVSTKTNIPFTTVPEKSKHRRCHSFGEEELAHLPDKRRDLMWEDDGMRDQGVPDSEGTGEVKGNSDSTDDSTQEEKKSNKKRGMLAWFKIRKTESASSIPSGKFDTDNLPNSSAGAIVLYEPNRGLKSGAHQKSFSHRADELSAADSFPESIQVGELFSATGRGRMPPPTGTTMADQIDLLREQFKMLAGEVAFCTSSLKRLIEQSASSPEDVQIQVQIEKTKEEIQEKRHQMLLLEDRIKTSDASNPNAIPLEISQHISSLTTQLNEKAFDLEIKSADNRILQEQLEAKTAEINKLQDMVDSLQQLQTSMMKTNMNGHKTTIGLAAEIQKLKLEMEQLKQERVQLAEEKAGLYRQTERLAQESAYAKELAAQAAVELKNLAQELTKLSFQNTKLQNDLMQAQQVTFQNAKLQNELAKLQNELTKARDQAFAQTALKTASLVGRTKQIAGSNGQVGDETALGVQGISPLMHGVGNNHIRMGQNYSNGDGNLNSRNQKMNNSMNVFDDINMCQLDPETAILELKKELELAHNRESIMEATMAGKEERETLLQKELDHAKHRESVLENDLAGMWVLVAKLKKEKDTAKYQPVFTDVQDCCQEDCQTVGRVAVGVASSPESMWQGCTKNGNFKDI